MFKCSVTELKAVSVGTTIIAHQTRVELREVRNTPIWKMFDVIHHSDTSDHR